MPKRKTLICCRLSFVTLFLLLISQQAMTQTATTQESKTVVLELDHVSVCGSNLDTLRQAFTDVGIDSRPRWSSQQRHYPDGHHRLR